ncbi:MAG TPA: tRNA (adenosine(37)-N6)-threonylcarbamoyltransferase complex dimerization subunit type 1 TsaB [Stellaceae bacterium]|nr:tRNA (adenosine(37)-N6)-threonylcarbamoyltransferase complex dimerization subunit type 1 TsaB [Stellaceae bacterium]
MPRCPVERHPERPLILALDAAGSAASVVVARGEAILSRRHVPTRHGQAETLLPLVDAAMREAGLSPASLDLVAVTVGPGGFTGIRVGLAAARGIALASGAGLFGVTGFEAVAAALFRDGAGAARLLVALESRREDLYVQLFDGDGRPLAPPASAMPAALARMPDLEAEAGALVIAGDAAERAAAAMPRARIARIVSSSADVARGAAIVADRAWLGGARGNPARPLYLRPPDVTLSPARQTAAAQP